MADELVDRAIDMGFLEDGGTVNFSIDTPEESLFQEYGMEPVSYTHLDVYKRQMGSLLKLMES